MKKEQIETTKGETVSMWRFTLKEEMKQIYIYKSIYFFFFLKIFLPSLIGQLKEKA